MTASRNGSVSIPKEYICPLSDRIMTDPMMSRYGDHFERAEILAWLEDGNCFCPITGRPLRPSNLVSNKTLRWKIEQWARANRVELPRSGSCPESQYSRLLVPSDTAVVPTGESSSSFSSSSASSASSSSSPAGTSAITLSQHHQQPRCQSPPRSCIQSSPVADRHDKIGLDYIVSAPPNRFKCALTNQVMTDPVISRNGINFERKHILRWLESSGYVCPVTSEKLRPSKLIPNRKLAREIEEWKLIHNRRADVGTSSPATPVARTTTDNAQSADAKARLIADHMRLSDIISPPRARRRSAYRRRTSGASSNRRSRLSDSHSIHLISLIDEVQDVLNT